jgi:sugar O-acyltransferase (sialic acid O-acetyltransferase NeuD family)
MKKVAIIGAGGNARELADWLRALPNVQLLGYLADRNGQYDSPVLGDFDWPANHQVDAFVMGVGDPASRYRIGCELSLRYPGVEWPVLIHPSAHVGDSITCGKGVILCPGVIATIGIHIGEFTQINYGCTVGHESKIGAACLINPGANISGGVELGRCVLIGTGSQVLQYRKVGDEARVGAGAVVTRDVEAGTTVVGVPARPLAIRSRG